MDSQEQEQIDHRTIQSEFSTEGQITRLKLYFGHIMQRLVRVEEKGQREQDGLVIAVMDAPFEDSNDQIGERSTWCEHEKW